MPEAPASLARLAADRRRAQQWLLEAWACGDPSVIEPGLQIVAEQLLEAADLRAGEQVLDVAAGCGTASLAAARRFARVLSTDAVPAWLERGRARARVEGLALNFRVAEAQALPFDDGRFDLVLSMFGVMYAVEADRAAHELLRVLRPGGRLALACWTPDGFVGQLLVLLAQHLQPLQGLPAPSRWGTVAQLGRWFGPEHARLRWSSRQYQFRYRSAAHWMQVYRDFHGPLHRVFAALEPRAQQALERDITTLLQRLNTAGSSALVVPADYLEAVVTRHG
ncbi:MAG: class I SAM-dependent methyltransferase [Rubrivivax sp.]